MGLAGPFKDDVTNDKQKTSDLKHKELGHLLGHLLSKTLSEVSQPTQLQQLQTVIDSWPQLTDQQRHKILSVIAQGSESEAE